MGVIRQSSNILNLEEGGFSSNSITATTTNQLTIDSFDLTIYRSAKCLVQATTNLLFHATEILISHDGIAPKFLDYGMIYNQAELADYTMSVVDNKINILATPFNANTTFKIVRLMVNI